MRRKDREVTRHGDLMEMVARFKVCRLGLWDGREVYVVPLNFGYEEKNGSLSLFFHCAREGRKLDILQNRPEVSFEMDGDHVLLEGDVPCRYSYAYGCVMGRGVVEFLREDEEKMHALRRIMLHQTGREAAHVILSADEVRQIDAALSFMNMSDVFGGSPITEKSSTH